MLASGFVPLEQSLQEAFRSMAYADMRIECADGGVPVHRSVLAAASPFLRPLLRDYNAVESHTIFLPEVSTEVMKQVLALLYTGLAFSATLPQVKDVLEAATLLGLQMEGAVEVLNVLVLNEVNETEVKVKEEPESELSSSDDEPEIVQEVAPPPKKRRRTRVKVKSSLTSETASVIGEMLESGQLRLTPGPGCRVKGQGHVSYSAPQYYNSPRAEESPDEGQEFTMSPEEILAAFQVASQKDHAYATHKGQGKGARGRAAPVQHNYIPPPAGGMAGRTS
jgi:hypothetical protein